MKAMLASLCLSLLTCMPAVAHARAPGAAMLCAAPRLEGTVNLNTASRAQLMLLPGVGPATADKMLAYREKRVFQRPAHIMRIKGIGKKTFEKLRAYLAVEGETTLHVAGSGS